MPAVAWVVRVRSACLSARVAAAPKDHLGLVELDELGARRPCPLHGPGCPVELVAVSRPRAAKRSAAVAAMERVHRAASLPQDGPGRL